MAAAAKRSENSGIFWMNGGTLTFIEPYPTLHSCIYLTGRHKAFRSRVIELLLRPY